MCWENGWTYGWGMPEIGGAGLERLSKKDGEEGMDFMLKYEVFEFGIILIIKVC
jgi:hypothetical protein